MQFNIVRAENSEPKQPKRISWPWKDMNVGDYVMIPSEVKGRAQVGVHVYGRTCGKVFTTKSEGDQLKVTRIE